MLRALAPGLLILLSSCSLVKGPLDADSDDYMEMEPHPRRTEMPSYYGPGSERVRPGPFPIIRFPGETWKLPPSETGHIRTVARWVSGHPERLLVVAGARAESAEYARQLSDLRAQTVRRSLIAAGAPEEKILIVSLGEDAPPATGDGVSFSVIGTGEAAR